MFTANMPSIANPRRTSNKTMRSFSDTGSIALACRWSRRFDYDFVTLRRREFAHSSGNARQERFLHARWCMRSSFAGYETR